MKKTVDYYLKLPYTRIIKNNEDGSLFIKILELPGCISEGDNIEEAYEMINDAMRLWINDSLKNGKEIPLPDEMIEKKYNGKIHLRIPKHLHKELVEEAEKNCVSLNTYLVSIISMNMTQSSIERKIKTMIEQTEMEKRTEDEMSFETKFPNAIYPSWKEEAVKYTN
ncbi:MAG: hypothetical protein A2Y33_12105 [Spirochaetes bacterium GWF1_51_8]|nr:MAG: hypothetical protein A2Y33_12105 [Spirochaetes bacterium GWF1_51_8]